MMLLIMLMHVLMLITCSACLSLSCPLILLKILLLLQLQLLSVWLVSYILSRLVQMPFGLETVVHDQHFCFSIVNPRRRILQRFFNLFRVITLHTLWTKFAWYDGIETPAITLKRSKLIHRLDLAAHDVAIRRLRTCPWPLSAETIAHEFFAPWQNVHEGHEAATGGGGIVYHPPGWHSESYRQPSAAGSWV